VKLPEARTVEPEAAGERLDGWLAAWLGSRAAAQRAVAEGRVLVDDEARSKSFRLTGGEQVLVGPESRDDGAGVPDAEFGVAWSDGHLMVVDKPSGVVVHPARGHRHGTLAQALAGRVAGGDDPLRPGIVHRLDRDTSGLLVVARSDRVHAALKTAMKARRIERSYVALVHGTPSARTGTVDAPIGRDRRVRTRMSTETDEPRAARTHFEITRVLPSTTLLDVKLETGRTHQIRVHLEAIGHPVCGDPEYGGTPGEFGLTRQFLHAGRLAFEHPVTGERVDVSSPLPPDLAAALERAESE
jgi:23S rRNA pseudouridine1911/1915/1917 synthase